MSGYDDELDGGVAAKKRRKTNWINRNKQGCERINYGIGFGHDSAIAGELLNCNPNYFLWSINTTLNI